MLGTCQVTIFLTMEQSRHARDALAKAVYAAMFEWVVDRTNECIEAKQAEIMTEDRIFIGLLDIFGKKRRMTRRMNDAPKRERASRKRETTENKQARAKGDNEPGSDLSSFVVFSRSGRSCGTGEEMGMASSERLECVMWLVRTAICSCSCGLLISLQMCRTWLPRV